MVVVVDRHPDVVQQRRRPEQLALDAVARVEPRGGELVEELEREVRDVRDVGVVVGAHPVLRGEVDDRRAAHVVEQRLAAVAPREVALEEDALAQARLGDVDRLEAALVHDGLHDERAAEDDVGAARLDARHAAALGGRQVGERLDERVERVAREDEALDAELGDVGLALGGGGEVAHRAADPDDPRPGRCSHGARTSAPATNARSSRSCLGLAGLSSGRKRSVMRTAPSGHESSSRASRRWTCTSCIEPPPMSSITPSASVVELTAAR